MKKSEEKERERRRSRAALVAFGALLAQYQGTKPPIKAIAKEAWEAGNLFLVAGFENDAHNRLRQYEYALHELKGTDSLKRILELDGHGGRVIDWFVSQYADKDDPLRVYAEDDNLGPKTFGQTLINMSLERQRG